MNALEVFCIFLVNPDYKAYSKKKSALSPGVTPRLWLQLLFLKHKVMIRKQSPGSHKPPFVNAFWKGSKRHFLTFPGHFRRFQKQNRRCPTLKLQGSLIWLIWKATERRTKLNMSGFRYRVSAWPEDKVSVLRKIMAPPSCFNCIQIQNLNVARMRPVYTPDLCRKFLKWDQLSFLDSWSRFVSVLLRTSITSIWTLFPLFWPVRAIDALVLHIWFYATQSLTQIWATQCDSWNNKNRKICSHLAVKRNLREF